MLTARSSRGVDSSSRERPNSRVKDLPDIALLANTQTLTSGRLREALETTFNYRRTHALPAALPEAPPAWETPYATMAREDGLAWTALREVTSAASAFLNPVLLGATSATWEPSTWSWR